MKKLEQYFLLPEIDQPPVDASELDENVCMKIENGNFIWDGDLDHPHIVDLNLTLKRGEVVAIVGDIGSGKSLLAAIMGQLKKTSGTVTVNQYSFELILVLFVDLFLKSRGLLMLR